ncbi:MAG: ATP-dependent helicase HrpB, partial [Verrucomicrobiae bacterium]|nr:ATP-dependent helicase HrpB [Verrucomicrobiae bacterium]
AFREHTRVLLTAPTGSGKSTQTPQILLDRGLLGSGQVVVLQPRRLAARLLAVRVAAERHGRLGGEVGYQVRFDNVTGPSTRIRFVTEGVLLRQMLGGERTLRGVSAVLFDEFHERHLEGDLGLALALELQRGARPDLRVGVMSATLPVASLRGFLDPCAVVAAEGRAFPVEIGYLEKPADFSKIPPWEVAAREFARAADDGFEGDALIFMPGAYEIARTLAELRASPAGEGRALLPLHGELPPAEQDAAVAPHARPKVVVATNVAETSLTLEGVRLVMDSGLARVARHDPRRGINTLLVEKISRASAEQRAGRAGRTAPGRAIRLWTRAEHVLRPAHETPEIRRVELSREVLALKVAGFDDLRAFRWLEAPDPAALTRAEALLEDLGALDRHRKITPVGRRMAGFPLPPRYARMLIEADRLGGARAAALMAALTQGRGLLVRTSGKAARDAREDALGEEADSDFAVLARAWRHAEKARFDPERCRRLGIHAGAARQVRPAFEAFLRVAKAEGLDVSEKPASAETLARCVLAGFSDHLARRLDAGTLRFALLHGRKGHLSRDSVVRNHNLLIAAEVAEVQRGRGDVEVVLSLATGIREEWLREMFPDDFSERREIALDPIARRVVARSEQRFRDLLLETQARGEPTETEAAALLAREISAGRIHFPGWEEATEQWILRLNRLREWCPDLGLPGIAEEERRVLLEHACLGARSVRELKDRAALPVVRAWISPAQQALVEKHAPDRVALPNGRRARVRYRATGPTLLSARIQDLFDAPRSFKIALGRVALAVEILAPNQRPVQVTEDLEGFWRDAYPRIRQELRRKYPKHEWR